MWMTGDCLGSKVHLMLNHQGGNTTDRLESVKRSMDDKLVGTISIVSLSQFFM